MNKKSDFSGARVGDRVWSMNWGWGTIARDCTKTYSTPTNNYFKVDFGTEKYLQYNIEGRKAIIGVGYEPKQTLFWDEIEFEIPDPPKREVKVRCKGYVNVWFDRGSVWPNPIPATEALAEGVEVTFELTIPEERLVELPFEYEVLS
jgi:hypothetical protein